ncbi:MULTISPECIES: hypothetical protein [Vibrio]|uniref:SnoaL-like domain-containing protein n=1 Tax=Vibrio lentus TaxID=136468 RepID=A0A1B9QE76_9VIBR|nr:MULTISPECIES: hypothetical protein [Vibrio]OCH59952.1 hypothetical protein A6E08_16680 [Vibrio lentus]PME49474.1 hypothetical protein BCV34_13840 [Vibrio lentus]PME55315.1 hypothetical protein BCV30_20770 [Vibrio lentus]PME77332.1 hypothetical protein BCV27_19225 [Vibrio lentus]PMG65790.1 hypothetical protein BCU86_14900 [Vibrio lentus]
MKNKLRVGLLLTSLFSLTSSFSVFAESGDFITCQSKLNQVNEMYGFFNSDKFKYLTKKDLEKFLAPNMDMITNNKIMASGYTDLMKHFELIGSEMKEFKILPAQYVTEAGNDVVIKYDIDTVNKSGAKVSFSEIAILSFNNDCKITRWDEIVYTKQGHSTLENIRVSD